MGTLVVARAGIMQVSMLFPQGEKSVSLSFRGGYWIFFLSPGAARASTSFSGFNSAQAEMVFGLETSQIQGNNSVFLIIEVSSLFI